MINKPTVLILGAGSSSHFGYPLGSGLINKVVEIKPEQLFNLFSTEEIIDFQRRLSRSGFYSIDLFLGKNTRFIEIGKCHITACLKTYEQENRLFPPNDSGWYQYLFNSMLTDSINNFYKNKVTIINFNYDRSLEAYLHNAIENFYGVSSEEALSTLKKIKIIHPHGMLGKYPEIPYIPDFGGQENKHKAKVLNKISKSIKIIHEIDDSNDTFCSPEFKQAHASLRKARKIYFLGFGFHTENLRRFNFFSNENLQEKDVFATNAGFLSRAAKERTLKSILPFGLNDNIFNHPGSYCESFFSEIGNLE